MNFFAIPIILIDEMYAETSVFEHVIATDFHPTFSLMNESKDVNIVKRGFINPLQNHDDLNGSQFHINYKNERIMSFTHHYDMNKIPRAHVIHKSNGYVKMISQYNNILIEVDAFVSNHPVEDHYELLSMYVTDLNIYK